jgi:hypothetical protein
MDPGRKPVPPGAHWALVRHADGGAHSSRTPPFARSRARLWILALACYAGCGECTRSPSRGEAMCGKCRHSGDCRAGLDCVNETCETAPPSCHVKIGL